jgi:hypothetical protein
MLLTPFFAFTCEFPYQCNCRIYHWYLCTVERGSRVNYKYIRQNDYF